MGTPRKIWRIFWQECQDLLREYLSPLTAVVQWCRRKIK
ncbi:hypothetical protein P3T21_007101 [Paraburkholderia sp. GAS334]